jgi:hypothetical protein
MNRISLFASLVTAGLLGSAAQAQAQAPAPTPTRAPAPAAAARLPASAAAHPIKGPTLAASANRALARDDVPSVRDAPVDVKAQADADLARRAARPTVKATRENLKGDDAAHAIAQQQKPSTYDRDIQMGDKDHTQQVTDVKVFVKK